MSAKLQRKNDKEQDRVKKKTVLTKQIVIINNILSFIIWRYNKI